MKDSNATERLQGFLQEQQHIHELTVMKQQAIAAGKLVCTPDNQFGYALAPNGERSHLSERQWLQVRSTAFKNWFGDWEKDPANASKIVDKNGEPQVLYHGTSRTFETFDADAPKTFAEMHNTKGLFFVTSDKEFALEEYAHFKYNLVNNIMREFNEQFFGNKADMWEPLIAKWNEFVKAIGTDRVDFRKKVPNGSGGYFSWTKVEFDGKEILPTDEMDMLWDKKLPAEFKQEEWETDNWGDKEILLPKGSKPVVMELFVNSRDPIYKEVKEWLSPQEMDTLFMEGMEEKGINPTGQSHIEEADGFGSRSAADSIVVKFPSGTFALAFFEPTQVKSATNNKGSFLSKTANIFE